MRIQAVTDEIAESLGLDKAARRPGRQRQRQRPGRRAAASQPGDIILTFDGKDVKEMRHLPRLVAETRVDKAVPVTVWRKRAGGHLRSRSAALTETETASATETPRTRQQAAEGRSRRRHGARPDAVQHHPELKEKFSLADDAKGVVVTDVGKDSAAAEKGLKPGDVIMEAAQEEIKSTTQVTAKIDAAKKSGRKSILLLVERQGDLRFVALRLDRGERHRTAGVPPAFSP